MRSFAMAVKSFPLAVAAVAGVALLIGVTLPGSPGLAQEESPITPNSEQQISDQALIARGNALLEAGDFASARLLYQAAATRGSGKAAMLTGVTFDPRYHSMAGISGPRSNARLARQWYALAMERGDDQARRNDLELVEWLEEQGVDPEVEVSAEDEAPASLEKPEPAPVSRTEPQSVAPKSDPAAEPAPGTETVAQPVPAEKLEADAEASTEASTELSAFDARVVRAHLTSEVNDREPVDRLASPIVVSDGRTDKITFFSEVRDLAGQTVSHRWEREGRTMAEVSFSIGGGTWRMHSSKRIVPAMTGAWRVVVVDASGAELASVPFTLE